MGEGEGRKEKRRKEKEGKKTGLANEFISHQNLGHNRIVTYSPVAAAVLRAFENLF